jgi:hypothetical protein
VIAWILYLGAAVAVVVSAIYLGFVGQRILDASDRQLAAQEEHNEKQEEIINRLDQLQRFFHREIADTADNIRKIVIGDEEQPTTGRHSRGERTA